jgi:hypothetical protein
VLKAITKLPRRFPVSSPLEVISEPTRATAALEIAGAQQVIGAQFFIPDSQFALRMGAIPVQNRPES